MRTLYVCNTSSDCLSKVNLEDFREEKKIQLGKHCYDRIGPHSMCLYEDNLLIANSYSNTISIVDRKKEEEVECYYIGMHCNDLKVYGNSAYVICGELNSLVTFDLISKNIMTEVPCGNLPHSIDINKNDKVMLVTNMQSDSICLIDCVKNEIIKTIKVGAYPTKAIFTSDGNHALVCESNIGMDSRGCVSIVSLKSYKVLYRIPVGNSPVDFFDNGNFCYVSNFGEGTISIIDINNYREVKRVRVGGMPRGIIESGDYIYIGDNYNNLLIKANVNDEEKEIISIGGEPTGMILV